jgi:hypothetical protein
MDDKKKFLCSICAKEYKHRQNLHRHMKLKHEDTECSINVALNIAQNIAKIASNTYKKCKCCEKYFKHSSSLYRHQKGCKGSNQPKGLITEEQHKAELEKLKLELTEKFTKMLNEKQGNINNIGNQLNDNATQNNYIIQLGKEDVLGTLTQKEKLKILNERYRSVLSLVKLMHCSGKYPQFNNSIISNLKSEFALTYSDEDDKFITTNKNELVSDIVSHRTANVEEILDENKEKITKQTNKKVKELIEILEKDGITIVEDETEFIKSYKTKIMTNIYDNRDELKKKIKESK